MEWDIRVGVSVKACVVIVQVGCGLVQDVLDLLGTIEGQAGTVRILIRIKEDVCSVVFVVTLWEGPGVNNMQKLRVQKKENSLPRATVGHQPQNVGTSTSL